MLPAIMLLTLTVLSFAAGVKGGAAVSAQDQGNRTRSTDPPAKTTAKAFPRIYAGYGTTFQRNAVDRTEMTGRIAKTAAIAERCIDKGNMFRPGHGLHVD